MKHYLLFIALLTNILLTGCIKEDLSDCNNVTICFEYKADGDRDVLYKYMDKVDLYVFDETNHFLGVQSYGPADLQGAQLSLRLNPGKYKLVALGNAHEYTEVINLTATDMSDIFFQNPHRDDPERVTNHDDNYLGQQLINVPGNDERLRDTVELFSAHIDVSVEIYGLSATAAEMQSIPYELSFEQSNAQTSFNNQINETEKGTCYPELIRDPERKCYCTDDFALFRMNNADGELDSDACQHRLVLRDTRTDEVLTSIVIYDYLMENLKYIDVTRQEALLPISIRFTSVGVKVEVPEWAVEEVKPEF